MNKVNALEKLLDGAEVQWKPLACVIKLEKGKQLNKELLSENGLYPAYNGGISHSGYTENYNYDENTIIISQGGASAGFVNFVTSKFYANAHCYVVLPNPKTVQNRYIYHFLKLNQEKLTEKQHGAGIPALRTNEILDLLTPIPCPDDPKKSLAIQAEIVRILDAFTALTAELTAELTARKKQYNHYRDRLLTFDDVEWKTLDDVCSSISAGGDLPENHTKNQTEPSPEFPYPIYANATGDKGLYGFTDSYKIESDAVTISARGAKIGYHTVREGKFTPIIRLITLVPDKSIISTSYLNYILDMTPIGGTDGGIPQLTVPTVKKISIPVPTITEQTRIVAILDKFDTLTHSLQEGLPREIDLRQKQYEYYRDMLLNFPKSEEKQYA